MPATINAVGVRPVLDGLFPVQKGEPNTVTIEGLAAKLVRNRQQQRGARSSVIRAYITGVPQRIVRINVRPKNDDSVFGPAELRNDVSHGDFARRRIRDKGVFFNLVAFQFAVQILPNPLLALAAVPPRTDRNDLL